LYDKKRIINRYGKPEKINTIKIILAENRELNTGKKYAATKQFGISLKPEKNIMYRFFHFLLIAILFPAARGTAQDATRIDWGPAVIINNVPVTKPAPATGRHGNYGSEYVRLLHLRDGAWLAGYTVSVNKGYDVNEPYGPASTGGLELQISKSTDQGKRWQKISVISDPGRDLDNTQLIETKNGSVLLACRSVRWQESYILRVYKSPDKGLTWSAFSVIDSTAGAPGALGHPDKGIYEPHMYYLDNGQLSVMYANEKHVTENPSYSQIISQKISTDEGKTWGRERWAVYEPGHNKSRPGMPVWTKMKNGGFMLVYEICGPEKCHVYCKTSADGISWPAGFGTEIPEQLGGPYVLSLTDGRLLVTSNSGNLSISKDYGKSWQTTDRPWSKILWGSLYQLKPGQIISASSVPRDGGGHEVGLKMGSLKALPKSE
jgi:hypothetical protein